MHAAVARFFVAMTQQQQNRRNEALSSLELAMHEAEIVRENQQASWNHRLTLKLWREEAQQLMLQVEQANADIRALTEAGAGSDSQIAVLRNENEHAQAQIRDAEAELARAGEGAKGIEAEAQTHRAAIETAMSPWRGPAATMAPSVRSPRTTRGPTPGRTATR